MNTMCDKLFGSLQKCKREHVFLALIILLGIGLRLYHLNAETLWSDEIRIIHASEISVSSILKNESRQNAPPLYILFSHFWMQLFGTGEVSVRSLSTLFGVLLIPAVYVTGRRMFNGIEPALISALLVAISPYQIFYSQDNRTYTLLPFVSLLSVYFLYRSLNEDRKTLWMLYIILTSISTYTHNFCLFLFPVGYVYLFVAKGHNRFALLKRLLLSQFVIILLYIPWAGSLWSQIAAGGATCWIKKPGSILVIIGSLSRFNSFCTANMNTLIALLTLGSIFFIFKGVIVRPEQGRVSSEANRGEEGLLKFISKYTVSGSRILLLEYLFLPLIIAYFFSILFQPIYAVGRYDNVSYPAFCLLVGSGIASIRNKLGRRIVIAGVVILTCNPLYNYYYNTQKAHESREVVSFIKGLSLGDRTTMIICPSFSCIELIHYFKKSGLDIDVQGFFPRNEAGAVEMVKAVMDSHGKRNDEEVKLLTHYDTFNQSKILEAEVRKYFHPVKEMWINRGATRVVYYEESPSGHYLLNNDSAINFRDKSQRKYLLSGWSSTEEWGTWSEGRESVILINFKDKRDYTMLIEATGFSVPGKRQGVRVYLDDTLLGEHTFTQPTNYFEDFEIRIPSDYVKEGRQRIRFVYSFTSSPAEHGMGPDERQLAVGVASIEFR